MLRRTNIKLIGVSGRILLPYILIALLPSFSFFSVNSNASMIGMANDCSVQPKVSEVPGAVIIDLNIGCSAPWAMEVPILLDYCLPPDSEVLRNGGFDVQTEQDCLKLHWEGLVSSHVARGVAFKVVTPGYYVLAGNVSLGNIPEKRLHEIGGKLVGHIPSYNQPDRNSQLSRKQFLGSTQEIRRMLTATLDLMPKKYYLEVATGGVRLEKWDFETFKKRADHWLKVRTRHGVDALPGMLLLLFLVISLSAIMVVVGCKGIIQFHQAPSFSGFIPLICGASVSMLGLFILYKMMVALFHLITTQG